MTMSAHFNLGNDRTGNRRAPGAPFRIVLLADCLGDQVPSAALGERTISRLDLDRFGSVLARLAPRLDLGEHGKLVFSALDDFHPDELCRRSPVLKRLLQTRRTLDDPRQVERLLAAQGTEDDPRGSDRPTAASDLERLLGGKVDAGGDEAESRFASYLASLVAPHVVDTRAAEPYRQATEQSLTEQLRGLLHEPRFQSLEACWRGLWWLVTELPADEIELYLLPVGRAELLADVEQAGTELAGSAIFKQLFGTNQSGSWSVITALYDFGPTHADVGAMAALSAIAVAGQATLLAGATPALAGSDSADSLADPGRWQDLEPEIRTRWQALRNSQAAARVVLGLPRLLMRPPYDPRNEPIESLSFSEGVTDRSQLLWGTAALGLTAGLGLMFQSDEWEMDPTSAVQLDELASFSFQRDGEAVLQPPTEVVLSDQSIEALARSGLTPLIGSRRRIEVVLPGCVSIAGTALQGDH
jgi:type VI secretion system protein ImpC